MAHSGDGNRLGAAARETIAQYYLHTNRGDFASALPLMTEDVVYRLPGDRSIVRQTGGDKHTAAVERLVIDGDAVVSVLREHAVLPDGREVDFSAADFIQVNEAGEIARFTPFIDTSIFGS